MQFIIGVGLCDIEFLPGNWRPLDAIRFQNIWLAILRDLVLLWIFFSYGALDRHGCYGENDEKCPYMYAITFAEHIPYWFALDLASLSMILLVLVSDAA